MPEYKIKGEYRVGAGFISDGEERTITVHTTAPNEREAIKKAEDHINHVVGGAKDLHVIDITTVDRIPNPPKTGKGGGKKRGGK